MTRFWTVDFKNRLPQSGCDCGNGFYNIVVYRWLVKATRKFCNDAVHPASIYQKWCG